MSVGSFSGFSLGQKVTVKNKYISQIFWGKPGVVHSQACVNDIWEIAVKMQTGEIVWCYRHQLT